MNQSNLFSRFFIILMLVTVGSLGIASFSTMKAIDTDPKLVAKLQEKFNIHINSSGLIINDSPMNHELTENQWDLQLPKKKITIKTAGGGIAIKNTSEPRIRVFASGQVVSDSKGNLLEISESTNELVLGEPTGTVSDLVVRIEIPNAYKQDIQIVSTSGDVSVENLTVHEIDLKTVSGDVTLNRLTAEQSEMTTISGEITVTDSSLKSVSGKTVSGDIEIANDAHSEAKLKSISGNVKLTIPQNPAYDFNLHSVSGSIKNTHAINSKSADKKEIEVTTTSGDIEIE